MKHVFRLLQPFQSSLQRHFHFHTQKRQWMMPFVLAKPIRTVGNTKVREPFICMNAFSHFKNQLCPFPSFPSHETNSHLYHTSCHNLKSQTGDSNRSSSSSSNSNDNVKSLIETWFYEVCPHGFLRAKMPFKTVVKSLNPQDYPDMNKVIIQLHYDGSGEDEIPDGNQLSQLADLYRFSVDFDEDTAGMEVSCDVTKGVSLPVICTLQVPLQFGISVKMMDDKDITVQRMESNIINIEMERGNCTLDNIKCGSISALCRTGNIASRSVLLGNVYFHTGKSGSITAEKLQGSNITCETEMGSVSVKSMYAENAIFRSDAGNISLGNCHGKLIMQAEKSQFKIESLEGDLDVGLQSGRVEAHLSRHREANVEVRTGDIALSFPEEANTDFNLDCPSLSVDKNINITFVETSQPHHKEGYMGEKGQAMVNARTLSGTIYLQALDWIQTTKLAFGVAQKEQDP